ncbi:hypothetical protein D3C75_722080 [compost metagenome]
MAAFQIVTRFDGLDNARQQRPRVHFLRQTVRGFMDKQAMTYAMARAVVVVQTHFPQWTACERVQLVALCTLRELQGDQRQEASQYRGVMQAALGIDLAKVQGACGIGGAVEILAARIVQVERFGGYCHVGFWCGMIVTHGGVVGRSRNSAEALLAEVVALLAEGELFFLRFEFSDRVARRFTQWHFVAEPGQEVHPCHAIFNMTRAVTFQFGAVFIRFYQRNRIGLPDYLTAARFYGNAHCDRRSVTVKRETFTCGKLLATGQERVMML